MSKWTTFVISQDEKNGVLYRDLTECIEQDEHMRGGQGFLSCESSDMTMCEQIRDLCLAWIAEHVLHFPEALMTIKELRWDDDDE